MSEREELERAYRAMFPRLKSREHSVDACEESDLRAFRFYRLLDAEAYLDAAMMLVPDDMRDELEITTLYQVARVGINLNHGPDSGPFYGEDLGNSIPLALCRAALKARETVK